MDRFEAQLNGTFVSRAGSRSVTTVIDEFSPKAAHQKTTEPKTSFSGYTDFPLVPQSVSVSSPSDAKH